MALILSLLVPSAGTFLWVYWHKLQIRREVKERMITGMDEQELMLLKFTEAEARSELDWEHAREFEYHGQMYDVVRSEVKGDTIYYLCWPDNAETKLNRQLNELVAQSDAPGPNKRIPYQRLFKYFQSLYYCTNPSLTGYLSPVRSQICSLDNSQYTMLSLPPPVPPPRFV
ncbi:MAG: hypothetical protein R2824_24510 [Saprospiraceae bacterium]